MRREHHRFIIHFDVVRSLESGDTRTELPGALRGGGSLGSGGAQRAGMGRPATRELRKRPDGAREFRSGGLGRPRACSAGGSAGRASSAAAPLAGPARAPPPLGACESFAYTASRAAAHELGSHTGSAPRDGRPRFTRRRRA